MKNLVLLVSVISLVLSTPNALAADSAADLLDHYVTLKPTALSIGNVDDAGGDFKGRNTNRANTKLSVQSSQGSSLSRSVSMHSSSQNRAQVENLESTSGELVQKVEDDRRKLSEEHQKIFNKSKDSLEDTYTLARGINISNLGSEQDPSIQNAFKCKNLKKCNEDGSLATSGKNARDIKTVCTEEQRLHWDGNKWSCKGVFEVIKDSNCDSVLQYDVKIGSDKACENYIFFWERDSEYTTCVDSLQRKESKCYRKKMDGKDKQEASNESFCTGNKPDDLEKACVPISYKSYTSSCPSGYTFNSSLNKCQK